MEANPQIEMQCRIMQNTSAIRDSIKGLYDWEKDMKIKEKQRLAESNNNKNGNLQPVRSHVKKSDQPEPSTSNGVGRNKEEISVKGSAHIHANELKDKGNEYVKSKDFKKAIHLYTEAIRTYKFDPIYFSNRALCYLKLKKYIDCIEDCTIAIQLDPASVKAFYRRMQANECLSNFSEALSDCEKVLELEPNNKDGIRSLETLSKLQRVTKSKDVTEKDEIDEANFTIKESSTVKLPKTTKVAIPWTNFDDPNDVSIDFIHKAPHLRPKQPLKKVEIRDVSSFNETEKDVKPKNVPVYCKPKDESPRQEQNTIEAVKSPQKPLPVTVKVKEEKVTKLSSSPSKVSQNESTPEIMLPKTTAQFHMTWASLKTDDQKYYILKETSNKNFERLLGSQFTYDMLTEIMKILNSHFVRQSVPIGNIMEGIVCSQEMNIFALLLTNEEKLAFTQLIAYMRSIEEPETIINSVEQKFNNALGGI